MTNPLVPYPITICGIEELSGYACRGISHVLTILDPEHPDPEIFAAFDSHHRVVWRFHDTILEREDQLHPTEASVRAILDFGIHSRQMDVTHLLIHCHMGVSRSTAAAAILMAQDNPGREAEAFGHLRAIRPRSWPNSRMIALADALLEREGRLVAGLLAFQRQTARDFPDLAAKLRLGERAAEVPPDVD